MVDLSSIWFVNCFLSSSVFLSFISNVFICKYKVNIFVNCIIVN